MWWAISFTISVILCIYAVTLIWVNWHHHPVTVTFDDKTTPIGMIPFPAITICSTQKLKNRINFTKSAYLFPMDLFPDEWVKFIIKKEIFKWLRHNGVSAEVQMKNKHKSILLRCCDVVIDICNFLCKTALNLCEISKSTPQQIRFFFHFEQRWHNLSVKTTFWEIMSFYFYSIA